MAAARSGELAASEKVAGEMATIEEELNGVRNTLSDLKSKLYGRFGKNIHLEE